MTALPGLWLALVGAARAVPVDDGVIAMDARALWTETSGGGFWPVRVDIENVSGQRRKIDVVLDGSSTDIRREGLELQPGEKWRGEFLVPGWLTQSVSVSVRRSDASMLHSGSIHVREDSDACLLITDRFTGTATTEMSADDARMNLLGCDILPEADVPADSIAWSGAGQITVDLERPVQARTMGLLGAWVRAGGAVTFHDPEGRLGGDATFGPWMEPRFRKGSAGYRMGLGQFQRRSVVFVAQHEAVASSALLRSVGAGGESFPLLPIPGVTEPPIGSFAALLFALLFALGPANYLLLNRLGRPEFWMLTTPVISLFSTGGIGVYALLSGGLGTVGASRAVGVLDQRSHTLELVEVRTLWAGAAPPRWLQPPAGTSWFPSHNDRQPVDYEQRLDGQSRLSGSFLGVRVRQNHTLVHSYQVRGRLEFQTDGEADKIHVSVHNLLGAEVERLAWRDGRGRWWAGDSLAMQQTIPLSLSDEDAVREALCADIGCLRQDLVSLVPTGGYLARVRGGALTRDDAAAVEIRDATQLLIGIVGEVVGEEPAGAPPAGDTP